MENTDYQIAKELKNKIIEFAPLIDFKVFGSRARGDFNQYSDMDVFVELEYSNKNIEDKIFDIEWEIGLKNNILISTMVFTRNQIENSALKASSIIKNVNDEGISV